MTQTVEGQKRILNDLLLQTWSVATTPNLPNSICTQFVIWAGTVESQGVLEIDPLTTIGHDAIRDSFVRQLDAKGIAHR